MMQMVTRKEWGARPARHQIKFSPTRPCTGHWNGPTLTINGKTIWDHKFCSSIVRGIQNFHMDGRGWYDIAYNWLVCPHGFIYEGRGLKYQNGANGTNEGNKTSPAICFMAGQANDFTDAEKKAFVECTQYVAENSSAPNGAIGHRDWKSTECPGDARYRWIRSGMPVVYIPEGDDDMVSFETHEAREDYVKKAYRNIAGREPSRDELAFWVYSIAYNSRHALDLILDLHGGEHKAA